MQNLWSKKVLITSIGVLLLTVLGAGYFYNMQGRSPGHSHDLKTVEVKRGNVQIKITETGSLEPVAIVEIKSEQSGEVKKLYVKAGDKVKPGDRLAIIQLESNLARQAAQFRANLETERLNMTEAERELDRQRTLLQKGFIPRKEMETAEKNLENARIRYDLAKRQLFLLLGGNKEVYQRYLDRDLSSDLLDEFVITSPTLGTIIELTVEEGEIIASGTSNVTGGTALMKIADLRKMRVKSKINEVNITQVRPGLPVEIRLDAILGKVYHGVVKNISPQGEKVNNIVTYAITMEINNSDEDLKPSMTANVDIITQILKDVLSLPLEALDSEGPENTLYVLQEGQKMPRVVKIIQKTESTVIIAEGITEGEKVVIP